MLKAISTFLFCASIAANAQVPVSATGEQLKFVAIVSRHGVRSPTGKIDQLNQYSAQPWPAWSVPPGYLTEHGAKLMTLFGAYDRELLGQQGLVPPEGCAAASRIAIFADSDQRTRETGKALAAGLMPGCPLEVHALAEGTPDPLFHPANEGLDRQIAVAAVSGRIGGHPEALAEAYRPQLAALEAVLSATGANESSGARKTRLSLLDIPATLAPGKGDHLVDLRSPLGTAATMAENLLLEYAEGMPQVGWGQVDLKMLRELMDLHTASADLERRTPYLARAGSANMLAHLLASLQQAETEKPVAGALGKPEDRVLILVGHDTNLANIAGTLHLNWLADGRRDDTPPGSALVFELWQKAGTGEYRVRTFFMEQTLNQMRNATPIGLASPPDRVPVFLPGCSGADFSCTWEAFARTAEAAMGPESLR